MSFRVDIKISMKSGQNVNNHHKSIILMLLYSESHNIGLVVVILEALMVVISTIFLHMPRYEKISARFDTE